MLGSGVEMVAGFAQFVTTFERGRARSLETVGHSAVGRSASAAMTCPQAPISDAEPVSDAVFKNCLRWLGMELRQNGRTKVERGQQAAPAELSPGDSV
jgi:hypothetical protein